MKDIIVCIKQVPGSSNVKADPVTGVSMRDGFAGKMNPYDLYALELGLLGKAGKLRIMRGIKAVFDEKNILNPAKVI